MTMTCYLAYSHKHDPMTWHVARDQKGSICSTKENAFLLEHMGQQLKDENIIHDFVVMQVVPKAELVPPGE